MRNVTHLLRLKIQPLLVALLLILAPTSNAIILAQEATSAPDNTTQSAEVTPPPKYVYNAETGLWENGTYSWNPVTHKTTPLQTKTYSYNTATGTWDTNSWAYDEQAGAYAENKPAAPAQDPKPPVQSQATDIPTQSTSSSSSGDTGAIQTSAPGSDNKTGSANISALNTGPGSTNNAQNQNDQSQYFSNFFNASISGNINSNSQSGDASILHNTVGGDATTGDALSMATILNMIQSAWGSGELSPNLYTSTIQGGYTGDLTINPGDLGLTNSSNNHPQTDLKVVSSQDASIKNDVNLAATSGNALVSNNTQAGDARTGDAAAVANIMNFINSSISANKSFIGVLNVLGDLEGDVLLPGDLTKHLLAANIPTANINLSPSASLDITNENDFSISNEINTTATSGDAEVSHNTVGGNATTGNAETSITVFNLVGQNIVAENALLVFVNVMGDWVGFITNAPAGSTSAMLGCCAGTSSSDDLLNGVDTEILSKNKFSIDNNINLSAVSGDATVSDNTVGGSAETGDAAAAANVLNVMNSSLSLSTWFGALFINIFGNWNGSFGTDTAFGGYSTKPNSSNPDPAKPPTTGNTVTTSSGETIRYIVIASTSSSVSGGQSNTQNSLEPQSIPEVNAATTETVANSNADEPLSTNTETDSSVLSYWVLLIILTITAIMLIRSILKADDESITV